MSWNKLNQFYYGGDYNPDQWDASVWDEDFALFKSLGINVITLPVFSWAKIQPDETRFCFEWLDEIVDLAEKNGISITMATPTAAPPAWMVKAYPDILPVEINGIKRQYGGRTQICPNSRSFRYFSSQIAEKMALRYAERKSLILWHVNNEYGTHCYCENCRRAFIQWLKVKYKTLENLNEKWYTAFWGHTYYDWDEIQTVSHLTELLPNRLGNRDGTNFQAMAIDYMRFMSESIATCFETESKVLKSITPNIPITTNIWGIGPWLDLFLMGRLMDVVSWDSYPTNEEHYSVSAFKHDIIRSLKKNQNFILMEQTPNQQNWQNYNALKRPGIMRLMSYQTMAHGADAIMFFQIRQSRGACEKYHAAMIPHAGHLNTRTGRELVQLGDELKHLSQSILNTNVKNKVALMMSWNNWWSVQLSSGPSIDLNYFEILHKYYKVLNSLNVGIDIIEPNEDLSAYDVVLAPLLNMINDEEVKQIENFVDNGGNFITSYFSGVVDENDLVYLGGYPGALRKLMGVWVEEVDALTPSQNNRIIPKQTDDFSLSEYTCHLICEVIHLEGADMIASYGDDFYRDTPCVTVNRFGAGKAIYIGTQPDERFLTELLSPYVIRHTAQLPFSQNQDIEIVVREDDQKRYYFLMNHSETEKEIIIKKTCLHLLDGKIIQGEVSILPKDVLILSEVN